MAQQNRVTGVKTDIYTEDGQTHVSYRGTRVVSFDANQITLRSGGWQTATTKTRMNQASHQFGLGYSVYAKDYAWYVNFKGQTIPFENGMTLAR